MADDRERVLRSLAGDRAAFGELVEAYQGSVFGLALSKLGSFAEAEDVAAQVMDMTSHSEVDAYLRNWMEERFGFVSA